MLSRLIPLVHRCLQFCWQALVAHGKLAAPAGPPPPASQGPPPAPPGSLPGPWHPERLCPGVPLSRTERLLARELRLGNWR